MPAIGAYCTCGLDNVVNCVSRFGWRLQLFGWVWCLSHSVYRLMYGLCISVNGLVICAGGCVGIQVIALIDG